MRAMRPLVRVLLALYTAAVLGLVALIAVKIAEHT